MQPIPGNSRQFSVLTIFIVMTAVACSFAAERWMLLAPEAFAAFEKVALTTISLAVVSAMLTNGFGTLRG